MKTYTGTPGNPPTVTVTDGHGTRHLGGEFGWGPHGTVYGGRLAAAILNDHLDSARDATMLRLRFMWRTVMGWDKDKPWSITSAEIDAVLAEIRAVENDKGIAMNRTRIANERPPVADERGIGLSPVRMK